MKSIISAMVALAVVAIFISPAHAVIAIKQAKIENGQVTIGGRLAQKRAAISWEGVALGISSDKDGEFKFVTADLPPDCVGRLKIGTEQRDVVISDCTPTPITIIENAILKTGQTNIFATGDDGDLQKGPVWPNPRFTDNLNGTITDNLTGLIWLKNTTCLGLLLWANAFTVINGLADGHISCGLSDGSAAGAWRMPNRNEYISLIDSSNYKPPLPSGHPFLNVQNYQYWSSTSVEWNIFPERTHHAIRLWLD